MNSQEDANSFKEIINKAGEADLSLIPRKPVFAYKKELDIFFEWVGKNNANIVN